MKKKIPVILALSVTSQCAPLLTRVNGEDLHSEDNSIDEDIVQLAQDLGKDQKEDKDYLEELLHSEKEYLNNDASILISQDIPAASTASLAKRDAVFVLEQDENERLVMDENGDIGWIDSAFLTPDKADIFDDVNQTMYVNQDATPVYASPSDTSAVLTTLNLNDAVNETGISTEEIVRVDINGTTGYVSNTKLQDHALTFASRLSSIQAQPVVYTWSGAILNSSNGSVSGPSGKETYYNLDMSTVVSIMRGMGFDNENYPYWVRSDGAKMLGPYVMVAADLSAHPKGTTMEISLGTGLVCDTGGFVSNGSGTKVDVATAW